MKQKLSLCCLTILLIFSGCSRNSVDITLLHWNDFHSRNIPWVPSNYNPDNHTVGGYAMLDAYLDALQDSFPQSLRIHAGDDFQGSPVCSMTKGESQIRILNAVKPDFYTIGNHEFDYGWKHLDSLRRHEAKFSMYAANITDTLKHKMLTPGFKVFKINGYPAAFIGITHPEMDFLTLPDNLKGITILKPEVVVNDIIRDLRRKGIDLFIVVSHMGIENDRKLAEAVPELDLIIGGHSHSYMHKAERVNGVYIVQASAHGRYIGVSNFHVNMGDITELTMDYVETVHDGSLEPSKDVKKIVDEYEDRQAAVMNEVIGTLQLPWLRSGGETNIGNFITDAFREKADADIAIQNDGGIRKDLAAGPIKVRDIWEITPFGNTMVTFTWSGEDLLQALNTMAKKRRSMQFSGISMVLEKGKGLVSAEVGGKPVNPAEDYLIATNNYTAAHLDKYFGTSADNIHDTGLLDRDILLEKIRKEKNIVSRTENRVSYK